MTNTSSEEPPKILYVDDNEDNRTLLSTYLKKWDLSCDMANNGKEGVDMCKEQYYPIVLMDIRMPVMNGFEATKIIKTLPTYQGHEHIYAISASATAELRKDGELDLFNEILHKPINFKVLKPLLFNILDQEQT